MKNKSQIASRKNNPRDCQRAKYLRKIAPITEQKLWNALRRGAKQFSIRFRRQHPISPYIVDFVCLDARLVIEVDGLSHDATGAYDKKRQLFLEQQGFAVIRFSNQQVQEDMDAVIDTIITNILQKNAASKTPPLTPPARGGE